MKQSKLIDRASGDGIFRGDLTYGRCNKDVPMKHKDFASDGNVNQPVVPLKLVEKRDPEVWRRDPDLDKKKTEPQEDFSYVLVSLVSKYRENKDNLKSNMTLIVGGQRV